MRRGAAIRPGREFLGRTAGGLRRRRLEVAHDADDAVERERRGDRLSVQPQLETRRIGGERQRTCAAGCRAEVVCVSPPESRTVR